MISEVVITGSSMVNLYLNQYTYGDNVTIKYRTADSEANCLAAEWNVYSVSFQSLGYTQVRLEVTE